MNDQTTSIPSNAKIETQEIPVEWLHELALREGNSKKPIYQIHKWWARRLGSIFRTLLVLATTPSTVHLKSIKKGFYLRHDFSDLTILDPFMGGGTSIIEASKFGAKTIGVDIDPIAWFTTKKEIEPISFDKFEAVFSQLQTSIGEKIRSYYRTLDFNSEYRDVIYYFWVELIKCPKCSHVFEAHPHYQLYHDEDKGEQTVICRNCHAVHTTDFEEEILTCKECSEITEIKNGTVARGKYTCPNCKHSDTILSTVKAGNPNANRLFAVEYEMDSGDGKLLRMFKAADAHDLELYEAASESFRQIREDLPFPRDRIPSEGRSDPRPISHGYEYYYQLFNDRQLLCLSLLINAINAIADINTREYLLIAFSDALAANNMLCSYAFGYQKLTPLFGLHAFNMITRPVENNVWGAPGFGRGSFTSCVSKMLRGKSYAEKPYELVYKGDKVIKVFTGETVSAKVVTRIADWSKGTAQSLLLNRSSTNIDELPDNSVDIVLTDPPYYNNLSYSELSDFFYVWLKNYLPYNRRNKTSTPYRNALYVGKSETSLHHGRFIDELSQVFTHCARLLKPHGLLIFTFHHREADAWNALGQALQKSGFIPTNVFPVRSEGKSGFHSSEGTIKWDAVFVCRPFAAEENPEATYSKARILNRVLSQHSKWQQRLMKPELSFNRIDALSLSYALTVKEILAHRISVKHLTEILSEVSQNLEVAISSDEE